MKNLTFLIIFSHIACIDWQAVQIEQKLVEKNYPLALSFRHISPRPDHIKTPISLGNNCEGIEFKIPPINDPNIADKFYFSWWLDKELIQEGMIEPENRANSIVYLKLNKEKVQSTLNTPLDESFYNIGHIIEFYISDRKYLILENGLNQPDAFESWVSWTVNFKDELCHG
jgi:hypothetical protein